MVEAPVMAPSQFHDVSYDHIWKKYCRSSQRAQHEIQEQSSNNEEQATRNAELYTSTA